MLAPMSSAMMSRACSFASLLQRGQQLSRALMAPSASPAPTSVVKVAHFTGHRAALRTTARAQASADPTQKQDWTPADMPSCDGKTFLVTGASSGLGFHCAKDIAAKGGHVIIAAEDLSKCQQAAQEIKGMGVRGKVEAMMVDLASFRSIVDFSAAFIAKKLPLHVLVADAGVFLQPHSHTQEGFESTIGINYYGNFLLLHLLLDKLRESKPSRIVVMASLAEQLGKVPWHNMKQTDSTESGIFEYGNSKIMLIMLSRELNRRLQSQGIEVFTANPGIAQTPLNNVKLDRNKLTANLVDITSNLIGQSAEEASYCISRPATDPTVSGYGGSYFSSPYLTLLPIHVDHAGFQEPINPLARDEAEWKRLYDESLKIVNKTLQSRSLNTIAGV